MTEIAHEPTQDAPQCKHKGCVEPVVDQRGMYAGLCEFHKNQKRQLRRNARAQTDGDRVDVAERFLAAARALAEAEAEYDAALEAAKR